MPKAIGRYLINHYEKYKDFIFCNYPHLYEKLDRELIELAKWIKLSKKNSFKLTHLKKFFSNTSRSSAESKLNRITMFKILT